MATDNYFESFEHDTSIDSLPSILSERPSNAFETLINYNITPKLLQAGDLTYGIEKGIHESREFVRKSANRNFKAPQIDRNSMLSPGRKEFVVEISDQNAFLQPETSNSKKYMNKKIIKGIKSSKITANLPLNQQEAIKTSSSKQKPKTPNKTSMQKPKSQTGFAWTSPNIKSLPTNSYTIMESSTAEQLNRKSQKSRPSNVPETIYESNLYPSTSTLGEEKPTELLAEKNASIVNHFTEEEHDHSHHTNEKSPSSPSESIIYKRPKKPGFEPIKEKQLNLSINLEESMISKTETERNLPGNKDKLLRPLMGVIEQKLITDDSMMDPPTTPNRTRILKDYSRLSYAESSFDMLGTNREAKLDNTLFFSPRSARSDDELPQSARFKKEDRLPTSPKSSSSSDESFVSCLSYDPNSPSRLPHNDNHILQIQNQNKPTPQLTDLVQKNSIKKIDVQISQQQPSKENDKEYIKSLLHTIEKENKTTKEARYAKAVPKTKDQPYLTQLNSQNAKKSLDLNKNREAMLKNSYKILKDLDAVWFQSEAERDEMIQSQYEAKVGPTPKANKHNIQKLPLNMSQENFDEQEFRHPSTSFTKEKSQLHSKRIDPASYTERSLTDIVLSNDFQPKIPKNVNLSISALKPNDSSQDLSKVDFSISQSNIIPYENDEYNYDQHNSDSLEIKLREHNVNPEFLAKKNAYHPKISPKKILGEVDMAHHGNTLQSLKESYKNTFANLKKREYSEKVQEHWGPESEMLYDGFESFSNNEIQESHYGQNSNHSSSGLQDEIQPEPIVEANPIRYRNSYMDQSQLPVIDEVSSTHIMTASYCENQVSLAQKTNLTNISIHSDYCLTEPDPNFSRILTEPLQDLNCGNSLDCLDLMCYENVQNNQSGASNRIITDSIREMNNYSTDEKQKSGYLLEGLKPELSSININLIKSSKSSAPQISSQRRRVKKSKYEENNTKRRNNDFISNIQKEKNIPTMMTMPKKIEKEKKLYDMGYAHLSKEVLQNPENILINRLDKNIENSSKTFKQHLSSTSSKAPLKLPKSTNSLTAIPITKKKLNDKENEERKQRETRPLPKRPDMTKEPLKAKILNSYTKRSAELGYKDENQLKSSRNSSFSDFDPLVSNEVLKGQEVCHAGMLNNYNFLDQDKLDVSRKHHKTFGSNHY